MSVAPPWGMRLSAPWHVRPSRAGGNADRALVLRLLPDCLAARLPGDLGEVERVVAAVEAARSVEAAADKLRPDIDLPGAIRWVRRRLSLRGVVYEADAALVGETVTLRFAPSRLGKTVEIWHKGRKVEVARRVDAYANCFVKRNNDRRAALDVDGAPPPPPEGLRLRDFGAPSPEDVEKGGC